MTSVPARSVPLIRDPSTRRTAHFHRFTVHGDTNQMGIRGSGNPWWKPRRIWRAVAGSSILPVLPLSCRTIHSISGWDHTAVSKVFSFSFVLHIPPALGPLHHQLCQPKNVCKVLKWEASHEASLMPEIECTVPSPMCHRTDSPLASFPRVHGIQKKDERSRHNLLLSVICYQT